jgi:Peptidase family M28
MLASGGVVSILSDSRLLAVSCASAAFGQAPVTRLNPAVKQIVDAVSEERIAATMKKLEAFGTRHVLSEQDSSTHGIGAARDWIFEEFKSYSPRLQVSLDKFTARKSQRVAHDVDLANVIAVLPGTVDAARFVVISAHYDSIAAHRGPGTPRTDDEAPRTPQEVEPVAPGVSDDGSGVAAVLELARIMSGYEFDKSVVFIAFSAEEVGLLGSQAYAARAKQEKMEIEAVLNNDIIGNDVAGNGRSANTRVRVFSEGPEDSPSRSLARYTKEIAERYIPSMTVDLIFRRDRFGRGGDHTSLNREGYAAVRLTTPSENYANQHTVTDTFANASAPYTSRVARINAAVLTTLALAPKPPVVSRPRAQAGSDAAQQRPVARPIGPGLTRGRSAYDAAMRWEMPKPEPDLAGYAIVIRATTSPV